LAFWQKVKYIITTWFSNSNYIPKRTETCAYDADFRPKTNAVILLDMGHTLRGEHIQEEQGKVGNPKLESVWYAHCRGVNIVALKQQRSL
jgi:hypothetical protein